MEIVTSIAAVYALFWIWLYFDAKKAIIIKDDIPFFRESRNGY